MQRPLFSKQLKKVLIDREVTQAALSELSGLPRPYVSMICNGRMLPTTEQKARICQALNVDPVKVFGREVINA